MSIKIAMQKLIPALAAVGMLTSVTLCGALPAWAQADAPGKYKTPDDAMAKLGHILGNVIAKEDDKTAAVKSDAEARKAAIQKQIYDLENGLDPQSKQYTIDAPPVEAACPHGQFMPLAQAQACNNRIAALNAEFAALKARDDQLKSAKQQVDIDEANQLASLAKARASAAGVAASIEACKADKTVMAKKACLDEVFDNTSAIHDVEDLDTSVVRPDYFGTTKVVAKIVKDQNRVHDDGAIRKVMQKKTVVPSPTANQ